MKFSENWLREWVNPALSTQQLVDKLTQAGLEVDQVEPVSDDFTGVVVGEVITVEAHPNADKLRLCTVDVAAEQALSIVCGAQNVRPGIKVPVAMLGAVLANNFKIKPAKLRGIASHGMLCSAKELGMPDNIDGLMELPEQAPVGQDIRQYMALDDTIIDIDLTPNRSDCLGIAGIAREVGVLTGLDITRSVAQETPVLSNASIPVTVEASQACPRYLGRVIEAIDMTANSPLWLQEKLRRSGVRSINPVVDVTNFVMLELGQPMHAFDLAKIDGGIHISMAREGESLELLDNQTITLSANTLTVRDNSTPLALAGIMGGACSGVSDNTERLFLEVAYFNPTSIAGRARQYGLHTDSSHRFERGVDPSLANMAIERATQLLLSIVGGKAGPISENTADDFLPKSVSIDLRADRIHRVLGIEISRDEVEDKLTRLGLEVEPNEQGWQVQTPTFRFDLAIEVDLIEELGRLYGYDKLPQTRPQGTVLPAVISESRLSTERLQSLMVDLGYQEAITYSFVDPSIHKLLAIENQQQIALANPISTELSVMRSSLWPGLIQAVSHNLNRQHERVRLFELGRIFQENAGKIDQHRYIGGAICGSRYSEQWATTLRNVDFFDIKADVEALLGLGGKSNFDFVAATHPSLHPGQSAKIMYAGKEMGWLGAIHPRLEKPLNLSTRVYLFELDLEAVSSAEIPDFSALSKFPTIRRDLALLVKKSVSATAIKDCLQTINSDILKEYQLFDVYSGEGVEMGHKSIAVAFYMQHQDRTLTDDDVNALISTITQELEQQIGATIRS